MSLRVIIALVLFVAVVWSIPHVVALPWLDDSAAQQQRQEQQERWEQQQRRAEQEEWKQALTPVRKNYISEDELREYDNHIVHDEDYHDDLPSYCHDLSVRRSCQ